MNNIKIAFVGMGSIARRHLHNVADYMNDAKISCDIDVYDISFERALPEELAKNVSKQILLGETDIAEIYDVIFITNPTSKHFDALKTFQNNGKTFFIEKPVFDTVEADLSLLQGLNQQLCYVACPLRYNPVVSYIKENVNCQRVISARAISSSYLPDWRPGTDYRQCYSAHTDMGGGVDIDLIHEWDYLTHLFGRVKECHAITGKFSGLEIDSNDTAIYIARTDKTAIELHLDYFGRKAMRNIQLFMPEETIDCDILNGTVSYMKSGKTIQFDKERNNYQVKEIEHFFDIVLGRIKNDSTIEHAIQVLKLAKGLV